MSKDDWTCPRCNTVNKITHRFCDKCFNEPVGGRRDIDPEGRAWSSDDFEEPDYD